MSKTSGAATPKISSKQSRLDKTSIGKLVAKGPAGAWELYDMSRDRTEMHDQSSAEPDKAKELVAKWETIAQRTKVLPWIWKPPYGGGGKASPGE